MQRCLKGDAVAWECLVDRYKRLVYHFPLSAGLDPEDCEEVMQDTFLALYQSMSKVNESEGLAGWLSTVAQRTTWRCLHRRLGREEKEVPQEYDVADPDHIPDSNVELKIFQTKLRRALAEQKKKCRVLLHHLFYEAESEDYDQVAKELGIARGSIGPTRKRCLVKLKETLKRFGITEKNVSRWL